ncbi:MAG TPA: DHHA1 domain-containing protein [Candidatus Binatia bacterium]|nr:DHHA1 domain-containing protein [Candidatus Binatia bacterium]
MTDLPIDLEAFAQAVPEATVAAVRRSRTVLAVGHEHPDADTLGATLGVVRLVAWLGGRATPVCADPVPELYRFLPGIEAFRTEPDPDLDYDLLVLSDCGALDRIGPLLERHRERIEALPRLVLDHHATNEARGPADWVDPEAAATCELVALLAVRLGAPLDLDGGDLATALLAGIVMDTATFAHPNATPRTLAVAAALLAAGAPLAEISRRLYRTKPDSQLRLFGRVLDRLETAADGRIIFSTLTAADLVATGANPAHSEGLVDLLSQSETAEVAILFKEQGDRTRISVRTKPGGVDATVLTGRFGGGGHARAAGATIEAPLAVARERVLAEAAVLVGALRR